MIRLNRRTVLRLAVSATVLSALGLSATGCGGGGSSGGGGGTPPPNPPPNPPGGSTSVLQATLNNGASVQSSPINFPNGTLVTGVSRNGQSVQGDLNYNPWQAASATSAQVSTGTTVTWLVNGQGSGGSLSFVAR